MEDMETLRLKTLQLGANAFTAHNFIRLESAEPDCVAYCLEIRPESRNPFGMVHGGALYTLADNAAGVAVHTDGRAYVTQAGSLHFLRNQPEGTVRAQGRVRYRGRATCLAEVDITGEDGTLLATGEFTFFRVDPSQMERQVRETRSPQDDGDA